MATKWITEKDGNSNKHIKIDDRKWKMKKKANVGMIAKPAALEKKAWEMMGSLADVSNVDQMLLGFKKYSGLIGGFSPSNAMLIEWQFPGAKIVRSRTEWQYFGRSVNEGENPISILYPVGIPRKDMPGKVKNFIEKKRKEGLDDETIDKLVQEKFNLGQTGYTHAFGTGSVYDISETSPIPGKAHAEIEDVKTAKLYSTLKKIAGEHYHVKEGSSHNGLGYTAHSEDGGQEIVVMKVPGEDINALHTIIHEMSHANLKHVDKNMQRGIVEAEAEMSTYIVGEHYGFNFRDDSAAYIKGWLDDANAKGVKMGKENIDRVMNNARWIINEVSAKLEVN